MRLEFSLIYKSILHHVDHNKKGVSLTSHGMKMMFCFVFFLAKHSQKPHESHQTHKPFWYIDFHAIYHRTTFSLFTLIS